MLALISWTGVAGSGVDPSRIEGQDVSEVLDGNEEETVLLKRKKSSKGKDESEKLKVKKRSKKVKGERLDEIFWSKINPIKKISLTFNLKCLKSMTVKVYGWCNASLTSFCDDAES